MLNTYNIESLIEAIENGLTTKYLFFWGHTEKGDTVTKACLSQWYPSSFELEGQHYPTAEHYMMAEKARLFGDHDMRSLILDASHPGEAKKYGRQVAGFDQSKWETHRISIVVKANIAKFSQDKRLKAFLLGTRNRILVEASPLDSIWGIGLDINHPHVNQPTKWKGLNLLGFALMQVRTNLDTKVG